MNEIEKKFLSEAVIRGDGMLLFNKKTALMFIEECKHYNIKILGIDGFFLFGDKIQPSLENSIDFSSSYKSKTSDIYIDALDFIGDKNNQLFFEIVCAD